MSVLKNIGSLLWGEGFGVPKVFSGMASKSGVGTVRIRGTLKEPEVRFGRVSFTP